VESFLLKVREEVGGCAFITQIDVTDLKDFFTGGLKGHFYRPCSFS